MIFYLLEEGGIELNSGLKTSVWQRNRFSIVLNKFHKIFFRLMVLILCIQAIATTTATNFLVPSSGVSGNNPQVILSANGPSLRCRYSKLYMPVIPDWGGGGIMLQLKCRSLYSTVSNFYFFPIFGFTMSVNWVCHKIGFKTSINFGKKE